MALREDIKRLKEIRELICGCDATVVLLHNGEFCTPNIVPEGFIEKTVSYTYILPTVNINGERNTTLTLDSFIDTLEMIVKKDSSRNDESELLNEFGVIVPFRFTLLRDNCGDNYVIISQGFSTKGTIFH